MMGPLLVIGAVAILIELDDASTPFGLVTISDIRACKSQSLLSWMMRRRL